MGASYKSFEERIQRAIHIRFGLPPVLPPGVAQIIKKADKLSAYCEATQLAGFSASDAKACFGDFFALSVALPDNVVLLEPMEASAAQAAFLERFEALEAEGRKARLHAP
jgi:5'-deoxynucleotidase YfbR-like HD superfamily hydrolase